MSSQVAASAAKASDKKDAPKSLTSGLVFGGVSVAFDEDDDKSNISATKKPAGQSSGGIVHIRVQQRNGRKSLTTVQGLATDLDLPKILRALKKTFSTNGTILRDAEVGKVLQLQGDQRANVKDFLLKTHICEKNDIKVHGF